MAADIDTRNPDVYHHRGQVRRSNLSHLALPQPSSLLPKYAKVMLPPTVTGWKEKKKDVTHTEASFKKKKKKIYVDFYWSKWSSWSKWFCWSYWS